MVSSHDLLGRNSHGSFTPMHSRARQVRPSSRRHSAFTASSPVYTRANHSFGGGRQQHLGSFPDNSVPTASFGRDLNSAGIFSPQMSTQKSVVPEPTLSLQIRLRELPPADLEYKESRMNMKSVDNVQKHFRLVFSGDPGQDWMNHVNELERQQACKHVWIPRQFYYALALTLAGKAKGIPGQHGEGPGEAEASVVYSDVVSSVTVRVARV